ncbi:MAG: fused MFS/spermidine synthase [Betaproteobacteria bacterium]
MISSPAPATGCHPTDVRNEPPSDKPYASIKDGELSLRFHAGATQSRMRREQPDDLVLAYTRLLMGFQLFLPQARRVAMIGLGGGSIAKYALRHLRLEKFVAVENNPDVIAMRRQFCIPPDSERFQVIEENGGAFVQSATDAFDVLIVDAFTREGMPPQVCNAAFYDHCFSRLAPAGGVLALNFHASEENFDLYVARLRESFSDKVICIETEPLTNRVVFAGTAGDFPPRRGVLRARAAALTKSQPINFRAIANKIITRDRDSYR